MGVSKQFSDQELLMLLQQDDRHAFKEIYQHYWYKLYMVAYKRLRSKETSEEIVQNIFTKLWMNRKEMKVTGLLEAYLYTAVRYAVIDHLEKEATRKKISTFAYYHHQTTDNSTEESLDLHDLELHVQTNIKKLPSKCQSVFILSRQEYKTNREIAWLLGISEKTVENHMTNALRIIRTGLRKTGALLLSSNAMPLLTLCLIKILQALPGNHPHEL